MSFGYFFKTSFIYGICALHGLHQLAHISTNMNLLFKSESDISSSVIEVILVIIYFQFEYSVWFFHIFSFYVYFV